MQKIRIYNQALGHNGILLRVMGILYLTGASDVLFIPQKEQVTIKLKYMHDTSEVIGQISFETMKKMVFNIQIGCSLDMFNNTIQSTSVGVMIDNDKYNFRISLHPTNYGTCVAIRAIRSDFFKNYHITPGHGLTIIAGRTGSGKTTVMYSLISHFAGHVVTLEDPVEYEILNAIQTDVTHCGYSDGIKSILRQTPDLICIGEMRDYNSAQAAIRAALTGHRVLTTLHASDLATVYERLNELGCEHHNNIITQVIFVNNFIPEVLYLNQPTISS